MFQSDIVHQIIHRELGDAATQRLSFSHWNLIQQFLQMQDYLQTVIHFLANLLMIHLMGYGVRILTIVISLSLHLEDSFGTQEKLRGKLLIFSIYDARRKLQGSSDAAAENIGAGRTMQVMIAHIGCARYRSRQFIRRSIRLPVFYIVESHDVWLMISYDVETMFVGGLYQIVVAIHKLDESALGYHHTIVSSHAGSLVRLSQIDDILQIFRESVDRTDIASIIHEDDFSFLGIE